MQGVFIHGSRPKTKKELRETVDALYRDQLEVREGEDRLAVHQHDSFCVVIEATSIHGNEFDGSLAKADRENKMGPYYVVGPDPYTSRKWYAEIRYNTAKNRWEVK